MITAQESELGFGKKKIYIKGKCVIKSFRPSKLDGRLISDVLDRPLSLFHIQATIRFNTTDWELSMTTQSWCTASFDKQKA